MGNRVWQHQLGSTPCRDALLVVTNCLEFVAKPKGAYHKGLTCTKYGSMGEKRERREM